MSILSNINVSVETSESLDNHQATENTKTNNNCDIINTALKLQQACATVGFDWPNVAPVFDKVLEELDEIKEAKKNPCKTNRDIEEEVGDLFFACINLARHLQVDPKYSLFIASQKFKARFKALEKLALNDTTNAQSLHEMTSDELEHLWEKAKTIVKQPP